jgi:hypothetical protein
MPNKRSIIVTRTIFGKLRMLKTGLPLACLLVAATAWSQVAPGSGDVSGNIGYDHVGQGSNFGDQSGNSFTLGANGGYNPSQYLEAGGELSYFNDPQAPVGPVNANIHIINYGGFARFNLAPNSRIVPYGVFGFGGSHTTLTLTLNNASASNSQNGYYTGFGGGASIYLTPNCGVRAEFRDNYNHFSAIGGVSTNAFAMTGGLFYQFGGHSTKKK